jgi:hypothetical protein
MPSSGLPEYTSHAVGSFDRLAVGAHDDAERGEVDGQDTHAPSVTR